MIKDTIYITINVNIFAFLLCWLQEINIMETRDLRMETGFEVTFIKM